MWAEDGDTQIWGAKPKHFENRRSWRETTSAEPIRSIGTAEDPDLLVSVGFPRTSGNRHQIRHRGGPAENQIGSIILKEVRASSKVEQSLDTEAQSSAEES